MMIIIIITAHFWSAHTPDNTFLGFVVEPHWSHEENKILESIQRKNQALVYGKRATFWEVKILESDHVQTVS